MRRVFSSKWTRLVGATLFLTTAFVASRSFAQNPSPNAIDPATEKPDAALLDKLMTGEKQYWSAWKAKDWATVRKMMGTDGIWVDPLNVYSTEGFIKAVETGGLEYEIGPRAFLRKPTPDVAVLVYDVKVGFGRAGAAPPKAEWRWLLSCVFVNRNGQWVGVSRSEVRGNRPTPPAAG
jgi:uncharacterized protein DUF4440